MPINTKMGAIFELSLDIEEQVTYLFQQEKIKCELESDAAEIDKILAQKNGG
ncbi:hypothetical protein AAD001_16415 [Colwelliaceae bacterium 6471]